MKRGVVTAIDGQPVGRTTACAVFTPIAPGLVLSLRSKEQKNDQFY